MPAFDRAGKNIESAETLTLSTTSPLGTRDEIRKLVRMALIPHWRIAKLASEIHQI
jgi:hypothetical protein